VGSDTASTEDDDILDGSRQARGGQGREGSTQAHCTDRLATG